MMRATEAFATANIITVRPNHKTAENNSHLADTHNMLDGIITKKTNETNLTLEMVDLFCGGGGSSTGAKEALGALGLKTSLLAINHWDVAIATHTANHDDAKHLCQSIDSIQPEQVVPGRQVHLLIASPECTHHSNARGGKPRSDQKRADAWLVMRWIEKLYVENLVLENVAEFIDWGPLGSDGKPDKKMKGLYFRAFIKMLRINYRVEWRILNAADYGDATTRKRFILIARRPKSKKIIFPERTHASRAELELRKNQGSLFEQKPLKLWVSAREIIDWSYPSQSIYNRKIPLKENTLKRIYAGLFKYGLKNFLVNLKATERRCRSIDEPTFTQTTGNHQYVCEPHIFQFYGETAVPNDRIRSIDEPVWTITGAGKIGLCEAFIIGAGGASGQQRPRDINEPLPTITGTPTFSLIEPFLVKYHGNHAGKSDGDNRAQSVDDPLKTLDTSNRYGIVEPYLVRFKHCQDAQSLDEHLKTLTTINSYGLVIPQLGAVLDIRFRMLQPHELAAAMSFPSTYKFTGTRADKVKQIGNAVPVKLASAIVTAIFTTDKPKRKTK